MAEHAKIAEGVEGFAYVDPDTNELVTLDSEPGLAQGNLRPATKQEIEGARRGYAAQGFGAKAAGLGEAAAEGATLGLIDFKGTGGLAGGDARARAQVLAQENPLLKSAATMAGTLVPTAVAGALTGGAAAGLGARAAGVLEFGAENLAQSAAMEMADAAQTDRDVEIGNIAQGLFESALFLGAGKLIGKTFGRAQQAVDDIAGGPGQALARAEREAATAADVEKVKPTRAEVMNYAANADEIHSEIDDLAYQAGNKLHGADGSASRAHSIQYKKPDIFGKMKDADIDAVANQAEAFADELDALGLKLNDGTATSAPSPAALRSLQAEAARVRASVTGDVEDVAIAVDGAKRHLDDLRGKFGNVATKGSDPLRANVRMIDEVVEPMRKSLEDASVWGKDWARKQAEENKLWSGKDGIINSRAQWQDALMERLPGAAGKYRTEFGDLPAFVMKDGFAQSLLKMGRNERRRIIDALDNDIAKTMEMGRLKLALGGPETRAAVTESMKDLDDFREAVQEAKRVVRVNDVGGPLIARQRGRVPVLEEVLDAAPLAGGVGAGPVGGAIGLAARAVKRAVGDAFTPLRQESKALAIDELRANIAKRNRMRARGNFKPEREILPARSVEPEPPQARVEQTAPVGAPAWQPSVKGYQFDQLRDLPPDVARAERLRRVRAMADWRKRQGGWIELPTAEGAPPPAEAKPKAWSSAEQEYIDTTAAEIRDRVAMSGDRTAAEAIVDEAAAELPPGKARAELGRLADLIVENREKVMALPIADDVLHQVPKDYYLAVTKQTDAVRTLSKTERAALDSYIANGFGSLKQGEQGVGAAVDKVPDLYAGLKKLEVENPTDLGTLYRGFNVDDDMIRQLLTQDKLVAHSMLSTSYSPKVAFGFANGRKNPVVLRIKKAAVGAMPTNPREAEILIPRGSVFKVVGRSATEDGRPIIDLVQTGVANPKAVAGAVALAAVLGIGLEGEAKAESAPPERHLAGVAAETQAIKDLDQHSKNTTERGMLQLGSNERPEMRLPPVAERFRGDYANLTEAYQARMGDLRRIVDSPEEFIARSTQAFRGLAEAGHPEVAAKLITRLNVGARYLLENAPPTLGASMFNPEGNPPDEIAVLQFAPMWEAVFRPLDAVRDFSSRDATPSAVRALREVHPDVYMRLQAEVFRTLAAAGPNVSFETKAYLDSTLGVGAALGRSWSPQTANLLAQARQDNAPTGHSLGGESNIAPGSPNEAFSKGPTATR